MSSELVQKLKGVRDLKKILETTVKDLGEVFNAESCQVMLSNPLDPNVTSICEYKAMQDEELVGLPSMTIPLALHGRTFGSLSLTRKSEVTSDEVNAMRVILGELGDVIRHAQINDIVQRDTFRDTFLVEIGNLMAYSLGIGDALFMVVNILGKVLQTSRCLFICTDDTRAGWKCYEFWQQEKVQSCQEYRWPTTDSPLIAQTLLSTSPLKVYEGQQNSYVSPVQEELQFIGVKSLLGLALRSAEATHGCVILQQCDYRRAWTRNEIDMVQNVADKVADALIKLPEEKRAREPIMQLHQRIVTHPGGQDDGKDKIQNVRKALKGALGQQAIPTASKTGQPPPPPKPAPPPPPPPPPAPATVQGTNQQTFAPPPATGVSPATAAPSVPPGAAAVQPTITPVQSRAAGQPPQQSKSIGSILNQSKSAAESPTKVTATGDHPAAGSGVGDPYADLDFGDFTDFGDAQSKITMEAGRTAPAESAESADKTWSNLDAVQPPAGQALTEAPAAVGGAPAGAQAPAARAAEPVAVAAMQATAAPPAVAPTQGSPWGDLDSIQAPTAAPARAGLGGMMRGKARASTASGRSPLGAAFHKDKGKGAAAPAEAVAEFVEGPVVEIDEVAAQAKLSALMSSSSNDTSDYIFATPGLDMRMLGRIDGWVTQIEMKDKYVGGHARQVAEYATAIARECGMSEDEIATVRQAALVHDVGKLGSAGAILQKPDADLSDPELIMVMKHPLDGAELLNSFPDLQHLVPIVQSHHEEFDGNGYPQGLKGDQIPREARIIHVANSYHGFTSQMRYGPGKSPTAAQNELVQGAGKQWDPQYVQALIQAILSKKVPASF